jgi:hypothetical protein
MKKALIAVILTVAVAAAGCSQGGKGAVVAKVNNTEITESQLQEKLDAIPAEYRMMMQGPEAKKRILDQLVLTELIMQEAEKQGLTADKEMQNKIKEMEINMKKEAESQIFQLKKQIENASKDSKERVIINEMLGKGNFPGVEISDQEVKEAYADYSKSMKARDPNASVPPLASISAEMKSELTKRKWVNSLKEKANITINDSALGVPPVSMQNPGGMPPAAK